jgi:hypothetical protein
MNKLTFLLAGVALIASSLPAATAEIPAKYRGEWCDHISGNYFTRFNPNVCKRGGIGYMRVTATRYDLLNEDPSYCRVTKVVEYPHRAPINNNHLITFDCKIDGAEGVPQTLILLFYTVPGKNVRFYIDQADTDQKDK